jgi:hypothetical protein
MPRAAHRVMHRKDHRLALGQRNDLGARLHARALLGEHELAAGKVGAGPRQQQRDLQRKDVLAVEILVQAVVVAFAVLQQERRRPRLPGLVAAREEGRVLFRIAHGDAHRLVPAVGDRRGTESASPGGDRPRQR